MAKKRKKKKSGGATPPKLTPQKYIQTRAKNLPFYKCFSNLDWSDNGLAVVIITRQQGGEKLIVGLYLLDVFCLGLKNTHYRFRMSNFDFDNEFLPMTYKGSNLEPSEVSPNYAQNLIYGAIEYAENLGFAPHKEYRLTKYILDSIESLDPMDFEFGKDGQPYFFAGPFDDTKRIMAILTKNVGIENFNYTFPVGEDSSFEE